MKKLVQVQEVEGEGLMALMGQKVTLYCMNYFYSGKLVGINKDFVKLTEAEIVYNTGDHVSKSWARSEKMPHSDWYVMTQSIESFGIFKE